MAFRFPKPVGLGNAAPVSGFAVHACGWGLLAFALLAGRFSPNWWQFVSEVRVAYERTSTPTERAAVEQAVLSAFSERGWHVLRQSRDLLTVVDNPDHKIVRWRLLMPAVGYVLQFPDWAILGLGHLGCLLWLVYLASILRKGGAPPRETLALVLILGASAPFFSSMGFLGYYDSWLVLALLAVAHSRHRALVVVACLLGPWVDERFVLGLGLALLVRWIQAEKPDSAALPWLKAEALAPLLLTAAYVILRLSLGGRGGSQTIGEYFRQFVFAPNLPIGPRLDGAWSGLRFGWWLSAVAVVATIGGPGVRRWRRGWLLGAGIVLTGAAGLLTALDLSRSMALLLPAASLGALLVPRVSWWVTWRLSWLGALLALALPAKHVIGTNTLPVDNVWTPSRPLLTAHNNLANLLAGIPDRQPEAIAHYTAALRIKPDFPEAHYNLAQLLARLPDRQQEAAVHFAETVRLRPGFAAAHNNLAVILARMPDRQQEALRHYEAALRLTPDDGVAHNNLANLLAKFPDRRQQALAHYAMAVQRLPDNARVRFNFARLLEETEGRKEEAEAQYRLALALDPGLAEDRESWRLQRREGPRRTGEP